MWKKGIQHFMLGILMIAVLAACSGNGGKESTPTPANSENTQTEGNKEGQTAAPTDAPKEPVELIISSTTGAPVEAFDNAVGNVLRKKFPQYKITYISNPTQSFDELLALNKKIDIVYHADRWYFDMLEKYDLQFDMTDLLAKHNIDLNAFDPGLIQGLKASGGGKIYGLPAFSYVEVLHYNKEIFKKFGVPFPKDGMTWDEILDIARKLTREDGGTQYLGLLAHMGHFLSMNQLSLPFADADLKPTFLSDDWKKILDTYVVRPGQDQGYQKAVKDAGGFGDGWLGFDFFTAKKNLAMLVFFSDVSKEIPDQMKGVDWDFAALPTFADLPNVGSQAMSTVFGLTSTTQHVEESMEVLSYLVSKEYQMEVSRSGSISVLNDEEVKAVLGKDTQFPDKNWGALTYNKIAPLAPIPKYWTDFQNILLSKVPEVMNGNLDVNTALREAQEFAEKTMAEKPKTGN
ncbi:ABC transporter substrate-binding protein [Paenibacillus eucommiae]|uniref:Multiple sugar transport system substrate-binding protein n=1 Tax=Paenibacillus eucommiae TaxID=1355755 RepID=A0ABS4IT66_9BACL|nr:extracellular solute-binding protein [Paenibacillus eucommiae]MBP1990758.1 multiple sugar transport system substrate-binding protein [Paenibacillus eucommiae]